MRRILVIVALCFAVSHQAAAEGIRSAHRQRAVQSRIEAFARKAMQEIGTAPGLTIVVVDRDGTVYRGDFGVRDVKAGLPVTADTRFFMASSTKAFTAMTAAILASEGKLDLDAPITTVWPELRLPAPLDPAKISLRDLLAMRSGIGNGTINFRLEIGNIADDSELLRLLSTYSRQENADFHYSNLSYLLAARVMEHATNRRWPDLVREKILAPLAMKQTLFWPATAGAPHVTCYQNRGPGTFVETPPEINDMAGPAGGMLTTSQDAAKWLRTMINQGRKGRKQVLPPDAVALVQTQQIPNKTRYHYFDRFGWGLGQDLAEYEGELLVHRFGGLNGAHSHVSFMPKQGIGVAAFSNGDGAVPDAVAAYAYDVLLGKKDIEAKWTAELARLAAVARESRERRRKADEAVATARKPAGRPAGSYVGTFHSDRLGDIAVSTQGGLLYGQLGIYRAELVPTGGDTFLIDWTDRGEAAAIKFTFDGTDKAQRVDWGGRIFDRTQ